MTCPICDQKPANCDCTPRERAMYMELQELEGRPAVVLTDAEREAVAEAAAFYGDTYEDERCQHIAATLRGLLGRIA